ITALFVTTALFDQLAREAPSTFSSLRHLLFGGETVDPRRVREVLESAPPGRLLHVYGPTESTTFATWQRVVAVAPDAVTVPIGRALANTRLYVLDRRLRPVPIGVPGELCLGGDGLARDYHARPGLSAESFVPDAVSGLPGERLYRTGDLVRLRLDGAVEFLGRIDDQVKIRGFRIEPGEVEVLLAQHPAVGEAVVVVRADVPAPQAREKRLVGYVVADEGSAIDTAELRAFIKERLPDYMVPAALVELDELPLTPNGKVDRRALPAPEWQGAEAEGGALRTAPEEILAGIWATVLGVERIGAEDDFFELGGHSLLATQVVSRVREVFGVELPLRKLFEAPTVAGLAALIEAAAKEDRERRLPPLARRPRDGEPLPLSFAQQRLWFFDQYVPGSPLYNLPSAVRTSGRIEVAVLARSLNEIVRRHEALRTTFADVGGQAVQVIAPALDLELPLVDLRGLLPEARESEARRLAAAEAARPFDLARGPLLRVRAASLTAEQHLVLLTMHHIVSDGWSMGVLIRELEALYAAFSAGRPSPLAEIGIQYADHAVWQRQWLSSAVLEEELGYWRVELAGISRLELPTDRPRPAAQSFRGSGRTFALSAELSKALVRLSREHGVTLFMTLLAGFKVLLARSTGQDDVAVGSPIAGRNHREIEELIGFFVNTLVLRTDLSGNPSFSELLGRVRRGALDAYAHQDVPFEHLVEELEPERDLSSTPLFQVMVALQNAPQGTLELPGLTLSPAAEEGGKTAKFDLTLSLRESELRVEGGLEYCIDLFDATTIDRFLAQYEQLLAGAVADPERRLSELRWWTQAQRHQLLVEWNDTAAEAPDRWPIHELLTVRAERTPEAVAVVWEGPTVERLSYGELDRRTNQLARYLRARGVGPEVLVGIFLERSPEMVIAILGILKAGGAWLPLDPEYPRERLAFMVADARPGVVLTRERLVDALPDDGAQVVCLRAGWQGQTPPVVVRTPSRAGEVPQASGVKKFALVCPDQPAYVIYTSGSTGRPKGVVVSRRGLANLSSAQIRLFGLRPVDRVLQFASLNFDASVAETVTALAVGASLHLASPERLLP
ncbi:MAG: AMP-binding protein, partial [bacterium]|nr:AMP-binding protein [bacterium]